MRYTVALGKVGLCYGKAIAVSTRRARRAHNKNKQRIVKRWRVCRPLLSALALVYSMRNFLNSVSCRVLRGCFKCNSLFMGILTASRFSSHLLALHKTNHSLSASWYSLCKSWVNLFSVVARKSFALQVRSSSQFRARQALGFSVSLQALTSAITGWAKASAFSHQFCWRYDNNEGSYQ